MQYIARIELNGNPSIATYVQLHAAAQQISFLREIDSDDGHRYKLPNGTYVSSAFLNAQTAHAALLNVMTSAGLRGKVLVMGSDGVVVWSGLDLISAPVVQTSFLGSLGPPTPSLGPGFLAGYFSPNNLGDLV